MCAQPVAEFCSTQGLIVVALKKKKRTSALGFSVAAAEDGSVTVATVTPKTEAHHAGLRTGDKLVAINEVRLCGLPFREAEAAVLAACTASAKQLKLIIRGATHENRDHRQGDRRHANPTRTRSTPSIAAQRSQSPEEVTHLTVHRGPDGSSLGLKIKGGCRNQPNLIISDIDAGSPAADAGLVPGHQLLEINGVSLKGARHRDVVRLIQQSATLRLKVCQGYSKSREMVKTHPKTASAEMRKRPGTEVSTNGTSQESRSTKVTMSKIGAMLRAVKPITKNDARLIKSKNSAVAERLRTAKPIRRRNKVVRDAIVSGSSSAVAQDTAADIRKFDPINNTHKTLLPQKQAATWMSGLPAAGEEKVIRKAVHGAPTTSSTTDSGFDSPLTIRLFEPKAIRKTIDAQDVRAGLRRSPRRRLKAGGTPENMSTARNGNVPKYPFAQSAKKAGKTPRVRTHASPFRLAHPRRAAAPKMSFNSSFTTSMHDDEEFDDMSELSSGYLDLTTGTHTSALDSGDVCTDTDSDDNMGVDESEENTDVPMTAHALLPPPPPAPPPFPLLTASSVPTCALGSQAMSKSSGLLSEIQNFNKDGLSEVQSQLRPASKQQNLLGDIQKFDRGALNKVVADKRKDKRAPAPGDLNDALVHALRKRFRKCNSVSSTAEHSLAGTPMRPF